MATGNPQNDYYLNLRGYGQPTAVPQTNTGFGGYGSGYEPSVGGYPQSTPTDLTFGNGSSYAFGGQPVAPSIWDTLGGYGDKVNDLFNKHRSTLIGNSQVGPGLLPSLAGLGSTILGGYNAYTQGKSAQEALATNMANLKDDRRRALETQNYNADEKARNRGNMEGLTGNPLAEYVKLNSKRLA